MQTSIENETKKCEEFSRPAIRIKRIPLDEAEVYLPLAWRTRKIIENISFESKY